MTNLSEMVRVVKGEFTMGSDRYYPEERPTCRVEFDAFLIDRHPVTNSQFSEFAAASGYVTVAERIPGPSELPWVDPRHLVSGSLVFAPTDGPVDLADPSQWWLFVPGADWRHPEGSNSSLQGRADHPVVHVAQEDAAAYARWRGKRLPSEPEWEIAARGGLEGATYAWGEEFSPGGSHMANTWQGEFPWQNLASDGYIGTSPVGSFPANGLGLFDMIGNVWEWTSDTFAEHGGARCSCTSVDPSSPSRRSLTETQTGRQIVVKGGSYLCAPNYCRRYRPAARSGQDLNTSSSHLGFRCAASEPR